MKQIFTTFLLSAMLLLSSFKAQQGIDEVVSALKSGNATELAKYLDDNVELTLPEKYDTYSKAQALVIIKDFFSNNKGSVFIDSGMEIIDEYKNHLSFSGQPGTGDMFFKELYNNIGKPACQKVNITKDNQWGYAEFPHCQELNSFDRSDRKFVAVAVAADKEPIILNATDSDWKNFGDELKKQGIKIEQLCPNCLK